MAKRGYIVSGRVQGVGFRAFVRDLGLHYGLAGAVWNTSTRDVEVVAEHNSVEILSQFEADLWNGPGRVEDVKRTDGSPYSVGPRFEIWPTR
jgi:acylphosphatase